MNSYTTRLNPSSADILDIVSINAITGAFYLENENIDLSSSDYAQAKLEIVHFSG